MSTNTTKMPIVIAHRGCVDRSIMENTLKGFKKCKDEQVPYVEFDVYLSKDKKLVVFHDDTLKRLFPDHPKADSNISTLNYIELPEIVPTLDQVLKELDGVRKIVEIKQDDLQLVRLIHDTINQNSDWSDITWGSFESEQVNALCFKLKPNVPNVISAAETADIIKRYFSCRLAGATQIRSGNQFWIPTEYRYRILCPLLRTLTEKGVLVVGCEYESGAINSIEEARKAVDDGCVAISSDDYVTMKMQLQDAFVPIKSS